MVSYLLIFGRDPELAFAELSRLIQVEAPALLDRYGEAALVKGISETVAKSLPSRLGGVVKVAVLLSGNPAPLARNVREWMAFFLPYITTLRPTTFGVSFYGTPGAVPNAKDEERIGLSIKRALKDDGVTGLRWVSGRGEPLSSVLVNSNRLTDEKNAELITYVVDGTVCIARTVAVQPYESWSERDYGRPRRNARAGMLPPKLARAMVNLLGVPKEGILLDPFCGSGTVLMEALLAGWSRVVGSDIDARAVADTTANIDWVREQPEPLGECHVVQCPVADLEQEIASQSIAAIVTEVALGPPCARRPNEHSVMAMQKALLPLYRDALRTFEHLLLPGGRAVVAFPQWETEDGIYLGVLNELLNGFTAMQVVPFPGGQRSLAYRRQGQVVGREIVVLERTL